MTENVLNRRVGFLIARLGEQLERSQLDDATIEAWVAFLSAVRGEAPAPKKRAAKKRAKK